MFRKNYLALALSACLVSPAAVASSEMQILIDMLKENGMVSDAQYQRLQAEMQQTSAEQEAKAKALAEREKALDARQAELEQKLAEQEKSGIEVVPQGGLAVRSKDGDFETKIGGRVQADAAGYSGDGDYGDGTEIRRARLYLAGKVYRDWHFKLEYDFAGESIADAWLSYKGLKDSEFKVGHFKDPFSLQEQTSSNNVVFTERALPSAFAAGRHIGVMASRYHQYWTLAGGLFGDTLTARGNDQDEGWGWGTRGTWAPINAAGKVLHFGLGLNYRDLQPVNTTRFRQEPETSVANVLVVDTSDLMNADSQFKTGLELATVIGPFAAQGEYIQADVETDNGADADFSGWYVQSSYFLTSDSRPYKNGSFGMIKPSRPMSSGGFGAWELAARLSNLDLNDGLVNGGEADSMTLGVNWYPVGGLRFSANYIDVLDVDGGPQDGLEPKIFQLRSQWAF